MLSLPSDRFNLFRRSSLVRVRFCIDISRSLLRASVSRNSVATRAASVCNLLKILATSVDIVAVEALSSSVDESELQVLFSGGGFWVDIMEGRF